MIADEWKDSAAALRPQALEGFPCTLLQEQLWARYEQDGPAGLNVAMRWAVQGDLPRAVAEAALQSLVRRHEILRTTFRKADGQLEQVVSPSCSLKLLHVDLSFLSSGESAARAEQMAKAEALEPMDPGRGPLMRATLLRLGPGSGMLLLTLHAMVADGWSTGLLISEFRAAASAIEQGKALDEAEPELQFVDYALWERELVASGALDDSRAFWRQQLVDAVGTRVPPDPQARPPGEDRSSIVSILLPATVGEALDAFAREHGTTRFALAVASLALMLHGITGDREIVFGSQVANREEAAAEGLVGPTMNSVTMRSRVAGTVTLHAFVRGVTDMVRQALQHQRLPFELARTLGTAGDGSSLHAVNLVVHRSYSGTSETEGGTPGRFGLVSLPSCSSGAFWDLNFFLIGRDEGWRLSCEADALLYEADTVRGLLEAWLACLRGIVTTPDCRLGECAWLGAILLRVGADRPLVAPASRRDAPVALDDPARHIVRFHEAGTGTPLIVINNRSVYYPLARELGEDRPFTDIQLYHPSALPESRASLSFEELAAFAVWLIRRAHPQGPYVLGGHCVYGTLAFEAARQLQAMGETVTLVALFDSWAPGYREDMPSFDRRLRAFQLGMHERRKRFEAYRRGEIGLDALLHKPILRRLGLRRPEAAPEKSPDMRFDDLVTDAAKTYRPAPYHGDVVLFRSQETLRGRLFDELMGWRPLVSGTLTKVEIESGHLDMFRERPARAIAAALRGRLSGAAGS